MPKDKELTTNPEMKETLVIAFCIRILMSAMMSGIPPCQEFVLALKLLARLQEICPDNLLDLHSNEDKFTQMAHEELQFLMKDN